jgi:hypothetical protein
MPETDLLCISLEPKSQGKFLADIYDIEYSYSADAPFDQGSMVQLLMKASIAFGEPIGPAAQALFDTHGQADVVVFTSGPKANQAGGDRRPRCDDHCGGGSGGSGGGCNVRQADVFVHTAR